MEYTYPYSGYGGEEEEHHHHSHHSHPPQFFDRSSQQQEEYGGYAPSYDTYTPPGPYDTHPPSGPYGTDSSSGYFYPHPHNPNPYGEYAPQRAQAGQVLPEGQLMRVFCKGNSSFNLAVENDTVVMQPADSQNEAQQWIKDSSFGLRVKDNYGHPAFSLINKKTQKVLKHSKEKGRQVLLTDYRPDIHDDDILWSESQDFGEGFKTVRSASDTLLNLTVFEGNKKIRNGSALVLDTWHKGDHQLWKLFTLW